MLSPHPRPKKHSAFLRGALLLHALLLAPWGSAPAAEEPGKPPVQTVGEEVIGIPEPMRPEHEYCFGGVLLPTKDNFYTVRDGLLSEYQIKPFKRVRSVALETDLLKQSGLKGCKVWANHDQSKLIVYNDKVLLLLDAKTGRLINSKPFPSGMAVFSARIEGDDIFILTEPDWQSIPMHAIPCSYRLMVWSMSDLKERGSIQLSGVDAVDRCSERERWPMLLVTKERVFVVGGKATAIIEREHLNLDMMISGGTAKSLLSSDGGVIRLERTFVLIDKKNDKQVEVNASPERGFLLDLSTRSGHYVENSNNSTGPEMSMRVYSRAIKSLNRSYELYGSSLLDIRCHTFCSEYYIFYQYENGEAIITKSEAIPWVGREMTEVSLTKNARKYLYMKVVLRPNAQSIVPINDATYKKFVTR
ncbi:MAG: hypothetical protein AB1766_05220 [Pseudomonadota bacterium]